ncbi:MAG: hypothetical protein COB85_07400, partial [Bacteroidetes bacterium]
DLSNNTIITSIGGFDRPHGLDITRDGSMVWVADYWNDRIVGIDVSSNTITSVIADSRLDDATGIALSQDGNFAYVTRSWNTISLLIVDLQSGTILTDFSLPGGNSQDIATSKNGIPWLSASPSSGTVAAGDSTVIIATANGLGLNSGTYTGNIIISSNDPNSPQSIPVVFTIIGAPILDLSTNCIALDTTMITATSTSPLWFYNNGCDTLFITSISNSTPEFAGDTNQMVIPPYDSLLLTTFFSPTTTGAFVDTILVLSNDVDTSICLSGFAIPAPIISTNPDSLNITINSCCDSMTVPVTIYNTGGGDLTIDVSAIGVGTSIFYDGFESGNISTWVDEGGAYTKQVVSGSAANGNFNVEFPGSVSGHLQGISHTFTSSIPDRISWYMKSSTTSNYGGFVVIGDNPTGATNGIIYMYQNTGGSYYVNTRNLGSYIANQWHYIELRNINFTAKTYDFYIDGVLLAGSEPFRNNTVSVVNEVHLYGWSSSDITSFDDITIGEIPTTWLNTSIGMDTVVPGDSTIVNVSFNSCGINSGTYTGDIIISSNDPQTPEDTVSVTFTINGTPDIDISPNCLDFDTIMEFTSAAQIFTIYNTGCDTLFITDGNNNLSEYTLSDTSGYLVPGDSAIVTVTFSPLNSGTYMDTIRVLSNGGDTTICLVGVALESPTLSTNPDSLSITINSCCDSTTVPITLYNTGNVDLTVDVSSIGLGGGSIFYDGFESGNISTWVNEFGAYTKQVVSGSAANGNYNVEFPSSTSNHLDGISHTFPSSTPDRISWYMKSSTTSSYGGFVVIGDNPTGATNGIIYMFQNTSGAYYLNTRTIGSYAANQWYYVELRNINFTAKTYDIYIDGVLLAGNEPFRNNAVSVVNEIHLYGWGSSDITSFDDITIGGAPVSWISTSIGLDTIAPGDSTVVNVGFNSCGLNTGTYLGSIIIVSNDPQNNPDTIPTTFIVNGTPDLDVSVSCLDFDTIMEFNTATDSFTIYNTGCDTLFITDGNNNLVEYTLSDTAGFVLPGDSAIVTVTFSPINSGTYADTITILTDAGDTTICLIGVALESPTISTNPDAIDTTIIGCCDTVVIPYTVYNTGNADLIYTPFLPGYDSTSNIVFTLGGQATTHTFNNISGASNDSLYLTITIRGDLNSTGEYTDLYIEGTFIQRLNPTTTCADWVYNFVFGGAQLAAWLSDGILSVVLDNSSSVSGSICSTRFHRVRAVIPPPTWLIITSSTDTIAPGDSTVYNAIISSCGLNTGLYSTFIGFTSNDPLQPVDSLPVTLEVFGNPIISLSDTCLYLDSIIEFTTSVDSFTIFNTGCDTLFISDANHNLAEYTLSDTAGVILPGDSSVILVTFAPLSAGFYQDTVTIFNNDTVLQLCLYGYGIPRPTISTSEDTIDVTLTNCCDSTLYPLTIYNSGGSDLYYDIPSCSNTGLDTILSRINMNFGIVNSAVPNRYNFSDGITGTNINDGGNDMYDGGNYLNTNFGSSIPYSDNVIISDARLGATGRYFTRKYSGLFVFAADIDAVTYFELTGNLGADGSGSADATTLTSVSCASTYRGFVKRVYGTTDPSVNHLIIVKDDPSLSYTWTTNTNSDQHRVSNLNVMPNVRIYYLLYASANGGYIDDTQTQNIMDQFLSAILSGTSWEMAPTADTIAPGDSSIVNINFKSCGLVNGTYSDNIIIYSNDPNTPVDTVFATLTLDGPPEIVLSDSCLYMDTLIEFNTRIDSFTITNNGCTTLVVSDMNNSLPAYSLSDTAASLAPGDSITVVVTFAPVAPGNYIDTIFILNNDTLVGVCLSGYVIPRPIISANPDSINITITTCDDSVVVPVTVYNTGGSDLIFNIDTAGYYANFDGFGDYVDVPYNSSLDLPTQLTLECWMYINSINQTFKGVIGKATGFPGRNYTMWVTNTNFIHFTYDNVSSTQVAANTPAGSVNLGQWHHVACVLDVGSNLMRVYIDGVIQVDGTPNGSALTNPGGDFKMARNPGAFGNYFDGRLDEVRIWNYARTQSQIQGAMNQRLLGNEAGLVGYWNFDDQTADDVAPLGNDGVFFGNATTLSGNPYPIWNELSLINDTVVTGDSSLINVTISTASLAIGTYNNSIIINNNDPLNDPLIIPIILDYTGLAEVDLSDSCLNFDTIFQFSTTLDSLYVRNNGCDTLFVTSITTSSSEFTPDTTSITILPGDSSLVQVTFAPTGIGVYSETLTVFNSVSDTTICLTGYALSPPIITYVPDTIKALITTCDDTVNIPLTIYNSGTEDLIFNGVVAPGYSMSVDGADDHIPLGTPAELQITGDLTIEMWVMPSNFSARRNPYAKAYGGEGTITQETNGILNFYY